LNYFDCGIVADCNKIPSLVVVVAVVVAVVVDTSVYALFVVAATTVDGRGRESYGK
jgi:hypothetical protein